MAWTVHVVENTLTADQDVFGALIEAAWENDYFLSVTAGKLWLDSDAMEHIDIFWQDWAQKVLNHYSVNGHVVFADFEGDSKGKIWGYQFDNGHLTKLRGHIKVEEV